MSAYKKLIVTKIIEETRDCKTIQLQSLDGQTIHYEPGQFLTFVFEKGSREERRSYSISSTPILNEPLSITERRDGRGDELPQRHRDPIAMGDQIRSQR